MSRTLPQQFAAAVCLAIAGYVHFKIWQTDYRHAPVREMFVANWVASAVVVVLLVVTAFIGRGVRPVVALGFLLAVGSLAAFALSRGPGLPTLHGTFKETGLETTGDYFFSLGSAKTILVTEALAALLCGTTLAQNRHRV